MGLFGEEFPAMDLRRWSLQGTMLFQRKLNELPQEVTLDSKFCQTV